MGIEDAVSRHYGRDRLEDAILDGLRRMGRDPERVQPADLAGADEFHIGGRPATLALAAQLGLRPEAHLLDLGSGLGGPARTVAAELGCRVSGVDLTPDYVRTATALTARVGLADRVDFREGSVLALPWPDASFDAAMLLHVGMNIADKARLFAEAWRVLRPGGRLGVYDVMRDAAEGTPRFPLPWAADPATSFLETPAAYRTLLEGAGFRPGAAQERRGLALDFFRRARAALDAAGGPPPLSLGIVMGPTASQKMANMTAAIEAGLIAPFEIIAARGG